MNGGVTTALGTAVVVATGSQKRKRGLAPTKKMQFVTREPPLPPSANGCTTTVLENKKCEQADPCVCLVCGNSVHELVNLHQNQELTKMLLAYVGLPSEPIDEEAAFVCVQCILKIKLYQEMRTKTKEKIKRTMTTTITTSTKVVSSNISAKKPPNICTKIVRRKVHSSPSSTSGCRNTKKPKATALSEPDAHIACLPTSTENTADILLSGPPTFVQREKSLSRCSNEPATLPDSNTKSPPTAPIAPPSATLQVLEDTDILKLKQRPSCNLDQRCGTHISRFSISRSPSPSTQNHSMLDVFYELKESALVTESGGKVNKYDKLEDPHVVRSTPQQFICKHCERLYKRKHFYTKHMRRCGMKTKSLDRSKTTKTQRLSDVEVTSRKLVFHCNVCPVTVESQTKLRKHKLIHLNRLYCPTCGNEFNALKDYEFHCVQCLAKQLNAATEQPTSSMRRITRSQSRAASKAATLVAKSRVSTAFSKQPSEDDDVKDDNYGDADDAKDNYGYADDDDDDDQCEAVSVADTMYTKRMRYTDHWVEDHSKRASNNLFLGSFDEDYLQISSNKEYDLYLLDRLKMDIMLESFPCYVPYCHFRGESHFKLMMHEFCDHAQKLLFHCKKCGNNFTRKVHLDFHLYCQNGGRYICFKCGDVFEFQDQLDRHLIRHTKNVNYRCNFCKFEFLTKAELLEHCDLENHDPNGERKLISIVPSMTIVNPTPPPKPSELRRQYKEHILIMHLPKIPHNTSLHKHFRRRLQVGDVQFKGQMHPNCSSCIFYM